MKPVVPAPNAGGVVAGRVVSGLAVAGLVLAGGLVLAAAPAAAYEYTGTFPGGNCRAMAQKTPPAALWYGHFTGQRQDPFFPDMIDGKTVEGCFRTQAECENWLYQWRSGWQFNFKRDFCVKGWKGR